MIFSQSDRVFDTLIDPRKYYGTMKTRFAIRKDVQVDGKCPVYLNIGGNARRINLKLYVDPQLWIRGKNRLKPVNQEANDINLILDNHEAKLTNIKTVYRLSEMVLTAETLESEFLNKLSRVNFVAFFKTALEVEKINFSKGTYDRHHSVYLKLYEYSKEIPFNTITLNWFTKYKTYLKEVKGNQDTTIAANLSSIKKFLGVAKKNGVKLLFDLEDLEVGSTKGNRSYLNETELKKCFEFYYSPFINDSYRLILGYFLFGCLTGLRISNIQLLNRKDFENNDMSLIVVKSNKDKVIALNNKARELINYSPDLFVKKFADQHINDELKKIMSIIGISKKVTMHVARHTFATLFLKMGGKVEILQKLLGHGSINQTMIYVHIVQADANKEIYILDKLF